MRAPKQIHRLQSILVGFLVRNPTNMLGEAPNMLVGFRAQKPPLPKDVIESAVQCVQGGGLLCTEPH